MRTPLTVAMILTMLAATAPQAAAQQTYEIAHSGGWNAYTGQSYDGTPICGMGVRSNDGVRGLQVKYFYGDPGLIVQVFKTSWRIPKGTSGITVNFGFDRAAIGTAEAIGGPTTEIGGNSPSGFLQFRIHKDTGLFMTFLSEFKEANQMWLTFPNGNEGYWTADMTGSRVVGNAFERCIMALVNRNAPTQPYMSRPAPTQPYSTQPYGNKPPQQQAPQVQTVPYRGEPI